MPSLSGIATLLQNASEALEQIFRCARGSWLWADVFDAVEEIFLVGMRVKVEKKTDLLIFRVSFL